jgi:hypothetical protein
VLQFSNITAGKRVENWYQQPGKVIGQPVPQRSISGFRRPRGLISGRPSNRLQIVQPAPIIVRFDAETSTITADWRLIELRSGTTYNIRTSADMERGGRWWIMLCAAGAPT